MLPENFWAGLSGDTLTAFFNSFWTGLLTILVSPLAAFADIIYRAFGGQ